MHRPLLGQAASFPDGQPGAVEGAVHPSRRVLAEKAYSDRRDDHSFVLNIHPFLQTSFDQGLSLRFRRIQPQEMATLIIRKEDTRPFVTREEQYRIRRRLYQDLKMLEIPPGS
jgi:hypothetical protein